MTLNSEEMKPMAIANFELRLSEGISKGGREGVGQSVGWSVSRSVVSQKIQLNRDF